MKDKALPDLSEQLRKTEGVTELNRSTFQL